MRVLITGAQGQLGHELMRLAPKGFETVGMGSAELDISDAERVAVLVAELQPQLIINAAAYTAVDKAESEMERAWAVNRDGVAHIAVAAERLSIPVLHISTDYVFAGDAREPYRECEATGPTGVYGASKLGGELELAAKCSRYMILRTSWVFAAQGNNFVKTMLRLGRERDQLGVVADQQGCPTSAASIARALWTLAMQYRDLGSLHWGTYHFSGTPACTWHEFALEIFHQGHQRGLITKIPQVRGIDSTEYPAPAKRPAWSVMDCSKLREKLGISQSDWRLELSAVISELAQSEVV
jgi:dTDP-4-dehydrorhamnose reductase